MRVDFTLFDKNGTGVIFGDTVTYGYDRTFESDLDMASAASEAPSSDRIINDGIDDLAGQIVAMVSPHKAIIERELATGGSDDVKQGVEYLENGLMEQAVAVWDQVAMYSDRPKAIAASYYNLGVIKEGQGALEAASELYRKAFSMHSGEKLYMEAIARVEAAKERQRKFLEQTEKPPETVPGKKKKAQ